MVLGTGIPVSQKIGDTPCLISVFLVLKPVFFQDAGKAISEQNIMLVGYARVSTIDQNPALQMDALKTAGCDKVFTEKASGSRAVQWPIIAV